MALITISRGSFAGGKAVAEELARRMSHPVLGREEVLAQAARDYGIAEKELTGALNESPPFWQQVPRARMAYVKCVTAVLLQHARQGNLVYHGHVGHLLLAGIGHVLRVRVIADMEMRVRSAMQRAGMGRDEAIAYIERVDRDRARWARLLYGVEWDDPHQYHLVLNLGGISVGGACDAIARVAELPELRPTAESRRRLEDLSLSCRVWAALARDRQARSAGVQVVADDGRVTITGSVGSSAAAEAIQRIAGGVDGVKSLQCEVGVGTDWYW